jgi:hypothetical protein
MVPHIYLSKTHLERENLNIETLQNLYAGSQKIYMLIKFPYSKQKGPKFLNFTALFWWREVTRPRSTIALVLYRPTLNFGCLLRAFFMLACCCACGLNHLNHYPSMRSDNHTYHAPKACLLHSVVEPGTFRWFVHHQTKKLHSVVEPGTFRWFVHHQTKILHSVVEPGTFRWSVHNQTKKTTFSGTARNLQLICSSSNQETAFSGGARNFSEFITYKAVAKLRAVGWYKFASQQANKD